MHPPRHALGALLAEQGRFAEAEQCFREDLGLTSGIQRCAQHPDNVWALQGLAECLQAREAVDEMKVIERRLSKVKVLADVAIDVACFCRSRSSNLKTCCD